MSVNTYLPPCPVTPPFLTIANITQSSNAVVTVIEVNNYVAGQCIYFSVPASYGMGQVNGLTGVILTTDGFNFVTDVNTANFNPFVIPSRGYTPATIAPAGSRNIYNNTTVPFHSVGNFGN